MKTSTRSIAIAVLFGIASASAVRAQSPSAGFPIEAVAGADADPGITLKEGIAFLVRAGTAEKLDAARIPAGQMLNFNGTLVPLPGEVTGFDAAKTTRSPAADKPKAAAVDPATTGVVIREGIVFVVRHGRASRLDSEALPDGQMLTADGRTVPVPAGIALDAEPASGGSKDSSAGKASGASPTGSVSAGSITPGTVTPGTVTPGRVEGSTVRGSDVRGSDVRGSDLRGGDVRGGDVRGGDVRGSDVRGGDVRGSDVRGGDVRGGDAAR